MAVLLPVEPLPELVGEELPEPERNPAHPHIETNRQTAKNKWNITTGLGRFSTTVFSLSTLEAAAPMMVAETSAKFVLRESLSRSKPQLRLAHREGIAKATAQPDRR